MTQFGEAQSEYHSGQRTSARKVFLTTAAILLGRPSPLAILRGLAVQVKLVFRPDVHRIIG